MNDNLWLVIFDNLKILTNQIKDLIAFFLYNIQYFSITFPWSPGLAEPSEKTFPDCLMRLALDNK